MQQAVSVITLGIADPARTRVFYETGFGWSPVFSNDEITFYQMNGFMLGLWLAPGLESDAQTMLHPGPGAVALGHNVAQRDGVAPLMDRLARYGGRITRPADAPPHGGFRGYVADPDGHLWEIAWNPAWPMDAKGNVTFGT